MVKEQVGGQWVGDRGRCENYWKRQDRCRRHGEVSNILVLRVVGCRLYIFSFVIRGGVVHIEGLLCEAFSIYDYMSVCASQFTTQSPIWREVWKKEMNCIR